MRRPVMRVLGAIGVVAGMALVFVPGALAAGPVIESESFSGVGSAGAELHATIDDGGEPSSFYVVYGTSSSYEKATASQSLGASGESTTVTVSLEGLGAGTVYDFQFVVKSSLGTDTGENVSFSTLPSAFFGLPDGRVAEMITPPSNHNAEVYVPEAGQLANEENGTYTGLQFEASESGSRLAYVSAPTEGGNGSSGDGGGDQQLASRVGPGVWSNANIQPDGFVGPAYQAFSSELSLGVLDAEAPPVGRAPLSPAAPTNTNVLYSRSLATGEYSPFFTDTPSRNLFAYGFPATQEAAPLYFAGASANFETTFFEADGSLTENAVDGGPEVNNLYASHGGALTPINVLPGDGSTEPNATFGAPWQSGAREENTGPNFDRAISQDGSRAFWTALKTEEIAGQQVTTPKALYVREGVGSPHESTTQIDGAVGGGGLFWAASAYGSKVYFTKGDLYQYDTETHQTTDLAPGGEVQGVLAASENGEYVYFVARAALASRATPQACDDATPRTSRESSCNLYLYREGQPLQYIGVLPTTDGTAIVPFTSEGAQESGDWVGDLSHRTAEATPDGHQLVFMSTARLTSRPTDGSSEVYLFDSESSEITCVSCSTTGEAPLDLDGRGGGVATGGFVPIGHSLVRQPRWINDQGNQVFFDSAEPLVANAQNGQQNVYEWEREGNGTCHTVGGCQYLLSGATSTSGSWLLDSSASGNDVFIATRARLSPQDENESYDAYDLSVGGVQPVAPSVCLGTGCQGAPQAPPVFATPSSATFTGVGNFSPTPALAAKPQVKKLTRAQKLARALKACRRTRDKRKRASCEKRARKAYGVARRSK
jgi:hypothetical protein